MRVQKAINFQECKWDSNFFGTEKRPFTNKVTILWDMPVQTLRQRDHGKQARHTSERQGEEDLPAAAH